jgi:hypothetical protein
VSWGSYPGCIPFDRSGQASLRALPSSMLLSLHPVGKEKGLTANREALSFLALGGAGQI